MGGVPPSCPGAPSVPPSRGPLSPRPGAPSVPPSRADPGPPAGCTPKVKNVFRFKIDAKSIPEALATTILILQKFSIDLAHRQNHGASAHPAPSNTPHPHLIGTPRHPWLPPGAHGTAGGGTPPNSATQTIIQLLFQFFPGVRNSGWEGSKQFRQTQNVSIKKADLGAGISKLGGYPAQGPPFTSEPR